MKSKSFEFKASSADNNKVNKTFDFVDFYKSAAETNAKLLEKPSNLSSETKPSTPKRELSPNKKKKKNRNEPVEVSHINIDGRNLSESAGRSSPVGHSRVTSTPYSSGKTQKQGPNVKSIMKSSSKNDVDSMDESNYENYTYKPKKRNKSVSFMLEDNEEVAVKKTKPDDSVKVDKKTVKLNAKLAKEEQKKDKKIKKLKKKLQAEKENNGNINMETDQADANNVDEKVPKKKKTIGTDPTIDLPTDVQDESIPEKRKKLTKAKKHNKTEGSKPVENESNNEDASEQKNKKLKKKKRQVKSVQATDTAENDEPATKSRKTEVKPDVIAEDLENLSIGDNAHTLTNLLDEMAVVDKDKKKKNKHRRNKEKSPKSAGISSSETVDMEKVEGEKEKVKWKKRKWNKDKKADMAHNSLITTVIVENLPLKIMMTYRKLLTDHFTNLGLIKKIGIAEMYPTEEPKPVFTTTIEFNSEEAATKALEEDNTLFEGSRIRIKRPLPATQTTLVVRSYGELSDQGLSSVFSGAGRIRNIRHLVKGKKSMSTAFIEFDGPEAVERAFKMAEDAKIGAKKIYVSRFEQRGPKKGKATKSVDSENEGDSEDSND